MDDCGGTSGSGGGADGKNGSGAHAEGSGCRGAPPDAGKANGGGGVATSVGWNSDGDSAVGAGRATDTGRAVGW